MLKGVEETVKQTIEMVKSINKLMQQFKRTIRKELPKIYSQDLLNNLFKHPYTKIEFVMRDLMVERKTAARYLNALVDLGLLQKEKVGTSNYYLNPPLINVFINVKKQQ